MSISIDWHLRGRPVETAGGVLLSGEVPRNQWAERSYERCGRGSDSHHPMAMAWFECGGVGMAQTLGDHENGPASSCKRLPCRHPHRAGLIRRTGSSRSWLLLHGFLVMQQQEPGGPPEQWETSPSVLCFQRGWSGVFVLCSSVISHFLFLHLCLFVLWSVLA